MTLENCDSVEALRNKLKRQKQVRTAIMLGCVVVIACGFGIKECYDSIIVPRKIYKEAVDLYHQGEYVKVNTLLEKIPTQEGVEELKKQMEADVVYNEYIDDVLKFGFYTESAVILADKLAGDDTKNSTYEEIVENIEKAKEMVSEYAAKIEEVPEELIEFGNKVSELQESYYDFVEFALNQEESNAGVSEELSDKREAFYTLYDEFELAVPEKKSFTIGVNKQTLYDFRHCNYGMTKEELMHSELEYYGLEPEYVSDDEIHYKSVEIASGMTGNIIYYIDALRVISGIAIEFPEGTNETDIESLLSAMYKVQMENEEIIISYNQYPAIRTSIEVRDNSTILALLPMEQQELADYRSIEEFKTNVRTYAEVFGSEPNENGYIILSPKLYRNMSNIVIMGIKGSFRFGDFDADQKIDTLIWESESEYDEQEFLEWLNWFDKIYESEGRTKNVEYFDKAYIWDDNENACEVWIRRTNMNKIYIEWFQKEETAKEKLI